MILNVVRWCRTVQRTRETALCNLAAVVPAVVAVDRMAAVIGDKMAGVMSPTALPAPTALAAPTTAFANSAFCNSGKETDGKKMEEVRCSFQPQQPLVCDTFKNCEGLSRVAFMDGNGVVMLGKVVSCERKEGDDKGGKKK